MAKKSTNGQLKSTTSKMSTKSEEKHLQTLSMHKHFYDFLINTNSVVGLTPEIRNEIVTAYKVHNPYYHYNDRCNACIAEMLHIVYNWYKTQVND